MWNLFERFLKWLDSVPGEDGLPGGGDDPHDHQAIARLAYDDDFVIFLRGQNHEKMH